MLILGGAYFLTAFCAYSQESTGRLSVAPVAPAPAASPAAATTPAPTPTQQPVAKAPEPTSNVVDAPLPEIANQPKVITPSQPSSPDGPKGPRDGRWYVGAAGGASLQQFQVNGTATAQSQTPLNVDSNTQLGIVVTGKAGYEFATRDVQMAFGGPVPVRTCMEFDFTYIGYKEKSYLNPTDGPKIGTENSQVSCWVPCLNGIVKFEELPVIPYFGGGIGAGIIYSTGHQIVVTETTSSSGTYSTSVSNASNVSLALQAIVGLEVPITERLDFFIEYKFLALMNVELSYGTTPTNSSLNTKGATQGGSSSTNDFLAQQLVSAGLKWSF